MNKTFKVEGMSCNHCVMHVSEALKEVDGVKSANVSLENSSAQVDFDESKVDANALKAAVDEAGYTLLV